MKLKKSVSVEITGDGSIIAEWWTPELGDIVCMICNGCKGWRSEEKDLKCWNGNQWCG